MLGRSVRGIDRSCDHLYTPPDDLLACSSLLSFPAKAPFTTFRLKHSKTLDRTAASLGSLELTSADLDVPARSRGQASYTMYILATGDALAQCH